MGGGRRIDQVEDVLALGDKVHVVVREIDDRGKVSLDLAEGVELEVKEGAAKPSERSDRGPRGDGRRGGRDRNRGGRDRGGRDGGRDRGQRGRDRGRDRDRDRAPKADSKPGRTVVSFEDEFEGGL